MSIFVYESLFTKQHTNMINTLIFFFHLAIWLIDMHESFLQHHNLSNLVKKYC